MKRDTFIQMVIIKQFFCFCIFRRNFNCHTSPLVSHQHPCRTFVLVFGMTLEIKKRRKTIFKFYQFSVQNYPCRPVLEGFELNQKTSPPFLNEQNRELGMFSGCGFKNFEKKCKNKKMFENDHRKSHENENRPKNQAKIGISQSKAQVDSKSQCHMKD